MSRYFRFEEPALEAEVDAFLGELAADLSTKAWNAAVAVLVLAGGYGRGEGGVFRRCPESPPSLYNDLEFFLILRAPGGHAEAGEWVRAWEAAGTRRLGIDVEFKVDGPGFLSGPVPTMFAHDLLQGHRVVWGEGRVLEAAPASMRDPAAIPPGEASRLLFNRGSGLLFAGQEILGNPSDPARAGFVERNVFKAKLALADAVLALAGRHHGLCEERARRIASGGFDTPPDWDVLRGWHAEGVAFKLRPVHRAAVPAALAGEAERVTKVWIQTFLWLETRRLGRAFAGPGAYARSRGRLMPGTPAWRNLALRMRDQLRHRECLPGLPDYPRAALMRALVAALSGDVAAACRHVGCAEASFAETYRRWWARYN